MPIQNADNRQADLTQSAGKDLVSNRARLGAVQKVKLLWNSFHDNGIVWTSLLSVYYLSSGIAEFSFERLQKLKLEKKLPGVSSLNANKDIWENWNWESGGEEWTLNPEWKNSLIKNVLRRYVPPSGHILEIGPGAGRWTGLLIEMAETFTAVDIAQSCIDVCRKKFAKTPRATFLLGNGKDLAGVADVSIDSLWSFDAFVHINFNETANYVREFQRVMHPGSVGVVHHGKDGGIGGGWRSNLTSSAFHELLVDAGFKVLHHFERWNDEGREFPVGLYHDEITVFCWGEHLTGITAFDNGGR